MKKEKKNIPGEKDRPLALKFNIWQYFLGNKCFCQFYAKKCRLIDKDLLSLYNVSSSKEHYFYRRK